MNKLFQPLQIGKLTLPNRILMAPLTRCRADNDHVPTELMAEYYAQRAGAGLLIAEATMVLPGHSAFGTEPAIYSQEQIAGWRRVTDAVHTAGGRIFLQIWHGGRACHPLLNNRVQPVAPSSLAITNDEVHTPEGKKPYTVPRALAEREIPAIVDGFAQAARNAIAAGFEGVEIHGANGYLLDQFLRDGSNQRQDSYGGPLKNRARLLFEVIEAVSDAIGHHCVGLRISPLNSYNSMLDSDPIGLSGWLAQELNAFGLAYLHVMRGDFLSEQTGDIMTPLRANFAGAIIGNMGYSADEAETTIAAGQLDAVAFGSSFLANPDLPERIKLGAPLNAPNPATFYSSGAEGYTDYPYHSE